MTTTYSPEAPQLTAEGTFQIDAGLRERWLTALLSEEYQGHEVHSALVYGDHYCALGLLAHIEGQEVDNSSATYGWLEFDQRIPVNAVWKVFDRKEMTFAQFADWLEAHSEPIQ